MRKIVAVLVLLTAVFMCVSSAFAITIAERDTAIARGLSWLARQQNSTYGYVDDDSVTNYYRVSLTAFAVLKWAEHANRFLHIDPFDPIYEYSDNIVAGLDYIFSKGHVIEIDVQTQPAPRSDDPDWVDHDGKGIYFVSDAPDKRSLYETGIVMMALEACGHPDDGFGTGVPLELQESYREIMQDMVDYVSWAQQDINWGRGGWRYCAWDDGVAVSGTGITNPGADNSVSQWPVLGLMSASEWGIEAPDFVKPELLNHWISYSQYIDSTDPCLHHGGFGYTDSTSVWICRTAAGMIQLAYCGKDTNDYRWDSARNWIGRHWGDPTNIYDLYGMYAVMKAAMTARPSPIWWFGDPECQAPGHEWQPEYDDTLLAMQDTTGNTTSNPHYGSWPQDGIRAKNRVLATEWALLILQKVAPPPPPPEGGTVIIPNKVYERFGFGHWDYLWPQDPPAEDNYIICDDACPPYKGINPGDWFEIPIIFYPPTVPECDGIAGFELDIEFDYVDLTFYGAMRGGLLEYRFEDEETGIFWSWEYFSYRVLPCTVPACQKYKILLFGLSDMPDGQFRRGYSIEVGGDVDDDPSTWFYEDVSDCDTIGPVLAWLKFQVANNELLRDLKLPIVFEWEHKWSQETLAECNPEADEEYGPDFGYFIIQDWDCAENSFSDKTGNCLFVSADLHEYAHINLCTGDEICGDQEQYPPYQILEFVDGGVHICSPCTAFKCVRGDINLDHIPNSTADAVLFARYFVEGIHVFILDRDEQVCATDVNADGRTLMLSDLVYLIRIILQDATAIPKLAPSSEVANVIVSGNSITTECAAPIAAMLFEFDASVQPTLLANMEMVNKDNKVLVWSTTGSTITTAEVLSYTGDAELVSVTAVDYDTRELQTTITAKVAPTAFALNPAYPNPFNPFTNLSFTLPEASNYSLKIYNVAGQLVRSYDGMGSVGLNLISWDSKDNAGDEVASGIYFYRLTAGSFTATRKMVVLK